MHFFLAGALAGVHEDGGADAEDPGRSYEAVRSDFEAAVNVRAYGFGFGVMCWGETGVCVWVGGSVGMSWRCGLIKPTPHHYLPTPPRMASQVIDKIYPKIMVNCLLVRGRFSPVCVC